MAGCSQCRQLDGLRLGRRRLSVSVLSAALFALLSSGALLYNDVARGREVTAYLLAIQATGAVWMGSAWYVLMKAWHHHPHARARLRLWGLVVIKIALLFGALRITVEAVGRFW